jgi:hypothetical protein
MPEQVIRRLDDITIRFKRIPPIDGGGVEVIGKGVNPDDNITSLKLKPHQCFTVRYEQLQLAMVKQDRFVGEPVDLIKSALKWWDGLDLQRRSAIGETPAWVHDARAALGTLE